MNPFLIAVVTVYGLGTVLVGVISLTTFMEARSSLRENDRLKCRYAGQDTIYNELAEEDRETMRKSSIILRTCYLWPMWLYFIIADALKFKEG